MTPISLRAASPLLLCFSASLATAGSAQTLRTEGRQWLLGAAIGTTTMTGGARGLSDDGSLLIFVPHRPTMIVGQAGFGRATRLELSLGYGSPGLALSGSQLPGSSEPPGNVVIVSKDFYALWAASAELSRRLLGKGSGAAELRGALGVFGERWSSEGGSPSKTVGGLSGTIAVEVPVVRRFQVRGSAGLAWSAGSPITREDLPEGFELRATLRRVLLIGLQYR